MLAALANPIIPIFASLLIGFGLQRVGLFSADEARSVNRFVFFVGTPTIVFSVVANADLGAMRWDILALYLGAELFVYALAALIARRAFGLALPEAILIGMAASFSNHVFFVLPIVEIMLGPDQAAPVAGIVFFDTMIFVGTVLLIDVLTGDTSQPRRAIAGLIRNPFLYATPLAVLAYLLGDLVPEGIFTFASFAGATAAPASLFAMGVLLAGTRVLQVPPVVWVPVTGKLLLHPLLVWLGLKGLSAEGMWETVPLLIAAGPCGAMPFVIALQFGVRTEIITRAVLYSTVLSLFSLAILI